MSLRIVLDGCPTPPLSAPPSPLHHSGTTVTIVLVTGALLTAANIGDSAAVLDTGCSMLELTDSHRIQVRGAPVCVGGP